MNAKPNPIKISKLDAARRQLETVIILWFNDGDPVEMSKTNIEKIGISGSRAMPISLSMATEMGKP
jgi:hypothetical protein